MMELLTGWGPTVIKLAIITGVFVAGWLHLGRELAWVRTLADHLAAEVALGATEQERRIARVTPSLLDQRVRDEIDGVRKASDPAWAWKQTRGWQMRADRLEPALAFWVDLLRQLGLLGTVIGLGISLIVGTADVHQLLAPLGLAVWATVLGLALSLVLSAKYTMAMGVWADTCEKNIEAWERGRKARAEAEHAP